MAALDQAIQFAAALPTICDWNKAEHGSMLGTLRFKHNFAEPLNFDCVASLVGTDGQRIMVLDLRPQGVPQHTLVTDSKVRSISSSAACMPGLCGMVLYNALVYKRNNLT